MTAPQILPSKGRLEFRADSVRVTVTFSNETEQRNRADKRAAAAALREFADALELMTSSVQVEVVDDL